MATFLFAIMLYGLKFPFAGYAKLPANPLNACHMMVRPEVSRQLSFDWSSMRRSSGWQIVILLGEVTAVSFSIKK